MTTLSRNDVAILKLTEALDTMEHMKTHLLSIQCKNTNIGLNLALDNYCEVIAKIKRARYELQAADFAAQKGDFFTT